MNEDIISDIKKMDEGKAILFSFGLMLKLGITSFDEIIKNGNKLIGKSRCRDKGCCNGNKQIKND